MARNTITLRLAGALAAVLALSGAGSTLDAAQDRQYLYCVSSSATPGGKAYFTEVFPGTWDAAPENEKAYFDHIARNVDDTVERSTTYCYALDTFDEAGLDRAQGAEVVRKGGWTPVDITWRP